MHSGGAKSAPRNSRQSLILCFLCWMILAGRTLVIMARTLRPRLLDSLAKSGVELDRMYVMPQCSPTRSAIMTGRHAWHTGLQHFTTILPGSDAAIPMNVKTIAEGVESSKLLNACHRQMALWATESGQILRMEEDSTLTLGYLQGQTDYYNRTVLSCGKFACLYPINCKSGFKIKNPPQCENPRAHPHMDLMLMVMTFGATTAWHLITTDNTPLMTTTLNLGASFKAAIPANRCLCTSCRTAPPHSSRGLQSPGNVERCVAEGVVVVTRGPDRTILCAMAARMDDAVAASRKHAQAKAECGTTHLFLRSATTVA